MNDRKRFALNKAVQYVAEISDWFGISDADKRVFAEWTYVHGIRGGFVQSKIQEYAESGETDVFAFLGNPTLIYSDPEEQKLVTEWLDCVAAAADEGKETVSNSSKWTKAKLLEYATENVSPEFAAKITDYKKGDMVKAIQEELAKA